MGRWAMISLARWKKQQKEKDILKDKTDAGNKDLGNLKSIHKKKEKETDVIVLYAYILLIAFILYHIIFAPLYLQAFAEDNSEFVLDVPFKSLFKPDHKSFMLDDAYVFGKGSLFGVIFSHDQLLSKYENSFAFDMFEPLSPLINSDCKKSAFLEIFIASNLSLFAAISFGVYLYYIFVIMRYFFVLFYLKKKWSEVFNEKKSIFSIDLFWLFNFSMMSICFYCVVTPFIHISFLGIKPNYALDISLKNTTFLPHNISYTLDEAYLVRMNNVSGVVFSHDSLSSDSGKLTFGSYVTKPLLPLIDGEYKNKMRLYLEASTKVPMLNCFKFGLIAFFACLVIYAMTEGDNSSNEDSSEDKSFLATNIKNEFEQEQSKVWI